MFPILLDLAEIVRKSLKVSRPSARIINVLVMGCVTSSLGCYVIVTRCHNVSLAGRWHIYLDSVLVYRYTRADTIDPTICNS